jgi:hypothetical protein
MISGKESHYMVIKVAALWEAGKPDFFLLTVCSVFKKYAEKNPVILQITGS